MKNNWKKVRLGDLFRVKHGYAFKGEYFSNSGKYILLTPGNFTEKDGLYLKGEKEKYYSGNFPREYILEKGDLLVAMTDLKQSAPYLGAPAIIKENATFLHNQRLGLITDIRKEIVNKKFLYWLFNSENLRSQIRGSATGSTVKHTAPERIYKCEVEIPEKIEDQKRIANILLAYDDLIENNNRRIKILEEMAQLIYKEWFVDFKFPGHEKVKMVEGELGLMPEGWEIKRLGDKINISKGKNITKNTITNGIIPVVAGGISPAYYHNKANTKKPVITISASGANAGFVNLYQEDIWASDCSYIDLTASPFVYFYYLLLMHKQVEISRMQRGAAQPHVYPKDLMGLLIFDIPEKIMLDFKSRVNLIFNEIENLKNRNNNLRQTRDLLLPKLMSGETNL